MLKLLLRYCIEEEPIGKNKTQPLGNAKTNKILCQQTLSWTKEHVSRCGESILMRQIIAVGSKARETQEVDGEIKLSRLFNFILD